MKGIYISNPPKPKYIFTWDVGKVLNYLSTLWPLNELSLKELTFKLTALIALTTAQRTHTLHSLNLKFLSDFGDYVVFTLDTLSKTTKPGQMLQKVRLDKYSDKKLCVVHTLLYYIEKTQSLRKTDQLLISFKTYKSVCSSTIARWLKSVLCLSGIDISLFSAHSYRGASTSKAYSVGLSLKDILQTANWKSAKTFFVYYNKEKLQTFSSVVLSSKD